jgi:diguanylate cyclase (GGDEF)-like protein
LWRIPRFYFKRRAQDGRNAFGFGSQCSSALFNYTSRRYNARESELKGTFLLKAETVAMQDSELRSDVQPDPIFLGRLARVQQVCLAIVVLIALVHLSGWLFPAVAPLLFRGWMMMKANTAILAILSALSLTLSQNNRSKRSVAIGRLVGGFVCIVAITILIEYALHISLGMDTLLAADPGSPQPGRMSPQSATSFALLGIVMTFIQVRTRPAVQVVDLVGFCLGSLILVIVSGYVFGVMHLFGVSYNNLTAPQTLLSLILLSFVAFGRRAEYGILSILVGSGMGSRIARVAAPLALLVPFMLEAGRGRILQLGLLGPEYSVALITALVAVMGFGLVLTLALRIDGLEQDIRDLSLRDGLTELFNRRGFLLMAERSLQQAHRARLPFSVLFIDLDNLKHVNDALGHDIGSALLCEMADMLKLSFRETDVVGRIGGDEFVVAGVSSEAGIALSVERLEKLVANRNLQGGRAYTLDFSFGHVTSEVDGRESLTGLLKKADSAMYAAKRSKKLEAPAALIRQ